MITIKKFSVLLSLWMLCLVAISQDTIAPVRTIHIGDLAIDMPGDIVQTTDSNRIVYVSEGKFCRFQVTRFADSNNVRTTEALQQLQQDFASGYLGSQTLRHYHTKVTDTAIGGSKGKFFVSTGLPGDSLYTYIYNYATPVNDHYYVIGIFSSEPAADQLYYQDYFHSIRFSAANIAENHLPSAVDLQSYNAGFAAGRIIGFVLVLAILGVVIFFIVKIASSKKRKKDY